MPVINDQHYWRCPSCHLPLKLLGRQWLCDNKHSYDQAKEGYVNLLLAQHKNSKAPGDNTDMVNARRAFLNDGFYLPLASMLTKILHRFSESESLGSSAIPLSLFDAGCGEGYYLRSICSDLSNKDVHTFGAGVDISKPAVQKAAKQSKSLCFAVASTYNLPILDDTQHAVIQVFAPSKSEEIARILRPKGIWLNVTPAKQHLQQLKSLVYDKPEPHAESIKIQNGFKSIEQQSVNFEIQLKTQQQRSALLMMTPFFWTISPDKKQKVLEELACVQVDFDINVMQLLN